MRILLSSHYFSSHQGGVELVADRLYREFTARGHQVRWIAGDPTPPPEAVGPSAPVPLPILNFVEARAGLPFPIPTFRALRTLAGEVRAADLVLLQDCLYLHNIAAFLLARLHRVPVVVVQHTRLAPFRNPLLNLLLSFSTAVFTRPMLARADRVLFISETTRAFFRDVRFRSEPDVIFNGVDTELYVPAAPDERAAVRLRFGLPPDTAVTLFVGRFVEKKGLASLRRMAELRPGWLWAFAGWGPLDPSAWNLPNVRVFSGLRGPSMAALYRACDALVLPSWGEGFPLVIQEALASGLPVVCATETLAADPAIASVVRGAPVFPGDEPRTALGFVAALEEAMASAASSGARRAFAVSRYSWSRAAERYLAILTQLCPASAAPRHAAPENCR